MRRLSSWFLSHHGAIMKKLLALASTLALVFGLVALLLAIF